MPMSAPIGLNPKILEQVAKELEKIKREKKEVKADQIVQQMINKELRKTITMMRSMQAYEKAELKRTLEEFKRFNEQLKRRLFGGR